MNNDVGKMTTTAAIDDDDDDVTMMMMPLDDNQDNENQNNHDVGDENDFSMVGDGSTGVIDDDDDDDNVRRRSTTRIETQASHVYYAHDIASSSNSSSSAGDIHTSQITMMDADCPDEQATMFASTSLSLPTIASQSKPETNADNNNAVSSGSVLFHPNDERFDSDSLSTILSFLNLSELETLRATSKDLYLIVPESTKYLFVPVAYLRYRPSSISTTTTTTTTLPATTVHTKEKGNSSNVTNEEDVEMGANDEVTIPSPSSSTTTTSTSKSRSSELSQLLPLEKLTKLLQQYSNLTSLSLMAVTLVGDNIIQILNDCPAATTLKTLDMDSVALSYWCQQSLHLPHLHHLTLSGNSIRVRIGHILKDTASYQNLQSLVLQDCNNSVRDDDIAELSRLVGPSLRTLTIRGVKLSKPRAYFPQLEHLKFIGCFHLRDLSKLNCPMLTTLHLSFCVKLTSPSISSFLHLSHTPNLKSITMVKCSQLESLVLDDDRNSRSSNSNSRHTGLNQIKLNLCHNLKRIDVNCPNLSSFEVHGCTSLQSISLGSGLHLHTLDLSQSSTHLQTIRLNLPALQYLNLYGCHRLNDCTIYCPSLARVDMDPMASSRRSLRFCKHIRRAMLDSWNIPNRNIL